jgi:imidazolonepropionase-like amidohydrolase
LTVLPGLIDCHVHLMAAPQSLQQRLLTPYSLSVAQALVHARETLAAGVTTVRDAGGTPRGVKLAIEQGLFPGPRVRVSVSGLSQTGGHGDQTMPSGVDLRLGAPDHPQPEHPWTVVDGVEGVRRATREVIRAGADQVKLITSGGVMSAGSEPGATGFAPEEIAAIVYEARAAGKTTMAHAQAQQGIRNAVEGGVDSIEHGIYLDEEVLALMKSRGTYLVPTLVAPLWVIRRAEADASAVPPYAVRKAREVKEAHVASFRMAVAAGVRVAMGTDSGVGPHGTNAEELQLMVEAGMSPMAALVAATKTAAECLTLGAVTGTLQPGKRADLLAVDGDPLGDVALLRDRERLRLIMKDGAAFKDVVGE